jgi:hypothetical protein
MPAVNKAGNRAENGNGTLQENIRLAGLKNLLYPKGIREKVYTETK